MGHDTNFNGSFDFDRKLTISEYHILMDIASSDHRDGKFSNTPGYYCQWIPSKNRKSLVWDESEKFYNYVEWIEWLIEKCFKPWGITVNGTVQWSGEEQGDVGWIIVTNNVVTVREGKIVLSDEEYIKIPISEIIEFAKDNFDKPLTQKQITWIKNNWYEVSEHPKLNWINEIIKIAKEKS